MSQASSKSEWLKMVDEFERFLRSLNEKDYIVAIAYNDAPKRIGFNQSVPATKENKKKIVEDLKEIEPSGNTDLHEALQDSYNALREITHICGKSSQ